MDRNDHSARGTCPVPGPGGGAPARPGAVRAGRPPRTGEPHDTGRGPPRPPVDCPAVRILITGAAGFIGSNFVRHWVEQHPDDHVVALDLLTYAGNRPNLDDVEDRIAFVQADIRD